MLIVNDIRRLCEKLNNPALQSSFQVTITQHAVRDSGFIQ